MKRAFAIALVLLAMSAAAQERDMARINWMEFRELGGVKDRLV